MLVASAVCRVRKVTDVWAYTKAVTISGYSVHVTPTHVAAANSIGSWYHNKSIRVVWPDMNAANAWVQPHLSPLKVLTGVYSGLNYLVALSVHNNASDWIVGQTDARPPRLPTSYAGAIRHFRCCRLDV